MRYLTQLINLRSVKYLFVPFLLSILFLLIYFGKEESHLMINNFHSDISDFVFKYITYLGDGVLFAILIFVFLFVRLKWSLLLFFSAIFTLLTVFISKKYLFHGFPRPFKYFEGTKVLHLVDGVEMYTMNTFPSGHTITAFAIFTILIFVVKNKVLQNLFVHMAILIAFSRVYLSQHFMIDVFFGAIIGVCIAVLSCVLSDNMAICQESWTEKSLIQIFDKKNELQV